MFIDMSFYRKGDFFMFAHLPKTYLRFLCSYLALLVVAFFSFILFLFGYLDPHLKKEIDAYHSSTFQQMVFSVDSEVEQLYRIDYQITTANPNLLSYFLMEDSPSKDIKIVNTLHSYISVNPFISEIALYPYNMEMVYTSNGICPFSLLFHSLYEFPTLEQPENSLKNIKLRAILTSNNPDNGNPYITFINPPSTFSNFPEASVLFWVEAENFRQFLEPMNQMNAISFIYDNQGNLLIQSKPDIPEETIHKLEQILPTLDFDSAHANRLGDYVVFASSSSYYNLCYITLFPMSSYYKISRGIQTVFYAMLISCLAVALLIIRYSMNMNYAPIKALANSGKELLETANNNDAITTLQEVLEFLYNQNRDLTNKLKETKDIFPLQDSLLFSLLKGKITTREQFNQAGHLLGIQLSKEYYAVLLFHIFPEEENTKISRDSLYGLFASALSEYEYYYRELFEPDRYCMLLGTDKPNISQLCTPLENFITEAFSKYGISLSVSVGNLYHNIDAIPTSYYEASISEREFFSVGRRKLVFFQNINMDTALFYPSSELSDFQNSLKAENYQKARSSLENIISLAKTGNLPASLAKGICENIAYLIITQKKDTNISSTTDTLMFRYLESIEDYENIFQQILKELEQNRKKKKTEHHDTSMLEKIEQFIQENYDNCSFSIQEMANSLDMNSSSMSQYFKNKKNITILDYTTELRIQKAKKLLTTSTMPLDIVAEEVGYYNTNSFIRRFKQVVGITPGEYRKSMH